MTEGVGLASVDLEALRGRALADLDDPLAELVRASELGATVRIEEWPGIGPRRVLGLTLGLDGAGLAELSFGQASYERTLRAFANAASDGASALSDLFLRYARPLVASAYRGAAPSAGGGDLHDEARAYVDRYLRARGDAGALDVRVARDALEIHGPRALGPRGDDLGARFGQGLHEIAAAFQTALRFVYSPRP